MISCRRVLAEQLVEHLRELDGELQDHRLRRVLEIIESHSSCSVCELAHQVGLGPAHLERLFKQEVGIQISELLSELKLQRAARLLSASYAPIKEIAYTVGYRHQSSFVRAFHHRFAQTPSRYREKARRLTTPVPNSSYMR